MRLGPDLYPMLRRLPKVLRRRKAARAAYHIIPRFGISVSDSMAIAS